MADSKKKVGKKATAKKAAPGVKKKAAAKKAPAVKKVKPVPAKKPARAGAVSAKKPAAPVMHVHEPEEQEMPALAADERAAAEKKGGMLPVIIVILAIVTALVVYMVFRGMNKQEPLKKAETADRAASQVIETETPTGTPVGPSAGGDQDESCTYVVQPKDSLISIAARKLGNENRWQEILRDNSDQIKSPDVIYEGQKFKVGCKK